MPRHTYFKQKLIDGLQRELDEIEKTWPMTHNYARVDPYITPYMQEGRHYELLIYHYESQAWFDSSKPDYIVSNLFNNDIIRPDDVVFDLGSNAGAVTVVLASLAELGTVHAFDPYPWNPVATRCNAALNGLGNVVTHAVGVSNKDSVIRVNPNETRVTEEAETSQQSIVIHDIRRYLDLKPTYFKLDIEGSEHELFLDTQPGAFPSVRGFVLELHPFWLRPRGVDPATTLLNMQHAGFTTSCSVPSAENFDVARYDDNLTLFWGRRNDV